MLKMYLSDSEKQLVEEATRFGESYFNERDIAKWYQDGGLPEFVVSAFRESPLGYFGLTPEFGGLDASDLAQMAILAELTKQAGAIIPLQSQLLDFRVISLFANEDQRNMILSQYEKTSRICFSTAISEPTSGSNARGFTTAVSQINGKLTLSGEKVFVANGQHAPYIAVWAKDMTDDSEIHEALPSFWLVPSKTPGITAFPINKIGQKMLPFAGIHFDNVEVEPEWRLGTPHQALSQARSIMDLGRGVVCASCLGLAEAAFRDAVEYAQTREVGGNLIGDFQQIGEMLVNMHSELINMAAHLHYAYDGEVARNSKLAVALMKSYIPQAAVRVTSNAMQIFGGIGYTDCTRLGRMWIDCRGGQFAVGTDQIANNIAAKAIMREGVL